MFLELFAKVKDTALDLNSIRWRDIIAENILEIVFVVILVPILAFMGKFLLRWTIIPLFKCTIFPLGKLLARSEFKRLTTELAEKTKELEDKEIALEVKDKELIEREKEFREKGKELAATEKELESIKDERRTMQYDLDRAHSDLATARREIQTGASSETLKLAEKELELLRYRFEELTKAHGKQKEETESYRKSCDETQEQLSRFENATTDIWRQPVSVNGFELPPYISPGSRPTRTRFVTFLNLKGGVGKTTIASNLGAAYASGVCGSPLRVLLVDLDFQGTLSNCCVDTNLLIEKRRNGSISARLLDFNGNQEGLIDRLITPTTQDGCQLDVIIGADELELVERKCYAQQVLQTCETRFFHRDLFHRPGIFNRYDLVLFDCPPRMTASTVNAILASDHVVVPSGLAPYDVHAVPRTVAWVSMLGDMHHCSMSVLLNRTFWKEGSINRLTNEETRNFNELIGALQVVDGVGSSDLILENTLPKNAQISKSLLENQLYGGESSGKEIFRDLATELMERIQDE